MKETFTLDKECKHSRRYAVPSDSEFPIKTVYVDRAFADGKDKITITITEAEDK